MPHKPEKPRSALGFAAAIGVFLILVGIGRLKSDHHAHPSPTPGVTRSATHNR
jgi:hypothetical protein